MYNLSYTQAIEMMQQGKRVKHEYFSGEEWFEMQNNRIVDEEGYPMDGWYRGLSWQDEGWTVIEGGCSRDKLVIICDELSHLEDRVMDNFRGTIIVDSMDYYVGITTPQTYPMPREKQNYNFRITKGRGHNKLQKRKKK